MRPRVVVIDNYDSFVYILVQYLGELGVEPLVFRNDRIDIAEIEALEPNGLLISPGPGTPEDAAVSNDVLAAFAGKVPIFGVCLGLQCIGQFYGGDVVRAPQVMHGKTSLVSHTNVGVFTAMPNPFEATRYHSLVVEPTSVPECLEVTATTADGTIMGLRHRELAVEGVQFHPESVLTTDGHHLVNNFVASCR